LWIDYLEDDLDEVWNLEVVAERLPKVKKQTFVAGRESQSGMIMQFNFLPP
jgi:hypothetical protein